MQPIINPEVDIEKLNKHAGLLVVVYDLLTSQAQPKRIINVTDDTLVMDLRVNLQKTACERLIVDPLKQSLPGYNVSADYSARQLTIAKKPAEKKAPAKRPANAKSSKAAQSSRPAGEEAA